MRNCTLTETQHIMTGCIARMTKSSRACVKQNILHATQRWLNVKALGHGSKQQCNELTVPT